MAELRKVAKGIYKDERGVYTVIVYHDNTQTQRVAGTELRAARRRLRELEREVKLRPRGKQLDEIAERTVGEALDEINDHRQNLPKPPQTVDDELKRLETYVYPVIGDVRILDLKAHHLVEVTEHLQVAISTRTGRRLAENTQANVWGTLVAYLKAWERRLRRFHELTWQSPADLLEERERPRPVRRPRGYYRRPEVEALLSDRRIPRYRRVLWLLLFATGMRFKEAAGLTWGDVDWTTEPLARIELRRQAARKGDGWQPLKEDKRGVGITREVPVHKTLARDLQAWRLDADGWALLGGRFPTDEDFIVPRPSDVTRTLPQGSTWRWLQQDCRTVGATPRAIHCTRNTFVTLVDEDAPELRHIAKSITHSAGGDAQDGYRRSEWLQRCAVMQAYKLGENPVAEVVPLPLAVGAGPGQSLGEPEKEAKTPTNRASVQPRNTKTR
ncbi:MAG: hypothetical protein AAGH15_04450 [Myxococcota bacterium]